MKYLKLFKKFLIGLLPVVTIIVFTGVAHAEVISDWCSNVEGDQASIPAGYHGESDGTCTVLQTPVTIDVNPVGSGIDFIRIDVNPADAQGNYGPAKTIDVNPFNPGGTPRTISLTVGSTTVSTTTPTVITSVEELKAYIFTPGTSNEEKIVAIENHIKTLLMKVIEILVAQIEALKANTPTPDIRTLNY